MGSGCRHCSERVGGYSVVSKVTGYGTISEGVDGAVLLAMKQVGGVVIGVGGAVVGGWAVLLVREVMW